MSKLMFIFGILFLAAGLALGMLIHFQPGQMQVLALTPDVAATFLVGGAVCLGLGNVAAAFRDHVAQISPGIPMAEVAVAELPGSAPATPKFTGFGSRTTTAVVETAAAVAEPSSSLKTSVADTISALEQAKADIATALGVEAHSVEAAPPPAPVVIVTPPPAAAVVEEPVAEAAVAEEAVPEEAVLEEGELFVVEEKVIRGRPARVLSDGTVEAETDEGWMRFENLEHLDEYLEAMVPER